MKIKEIILIGGGGHCKSCIEVIESTGEYKIAGIIDNHKKNGETLLGYPIIGNDNDLEQLSKKYRYALITVGQIQSPHIRINIYHRLKQLGFELPVIVASSAIVSKRSIIEEGTIVMQQCLVNANVKIGKNNIINTGAIIEHDANIGDHCHISTNAVINGMVTIGNHNFIGSNSTFAQNIKTVNDVLIGMGSVVTKDIDVPGIYFGTPLKKQSNE